MELFGQSVEKLNENFLSVNQDNFESLIVGSKILYDLNPNENQQKALDLFKNISKENVSVNLITAIDAFRSVAENHYFGKCSKEEIENIRTKLKEFFTEATIFKTPEEQANELINCVQGLSINSFVSSVNNDITDQMAAVNIR